MKSIEKRNQFHHDEGRQGLTLVETLIYLCILCALVALVAWQVGNHQQQRRRQYNGGFLRGIIHAIQDDVPEPMSAVVRRTRPDLIGYFDGHTLVTNIHEEHRDTFRQKCVALVMERIKHSEEIDSKLRVTIVQFLQTTGPSFVGTDDQGENTNISGTTSTDSQIHSVDRIK